MSAGAGRLRPEVKAKWLEALRSGEYQQGRNYLHQTDGRMCCLGVLCHLAELEGVVERRDLHGGWFTYGGWSTTMPPFAVAEWAYAELPDDDVAWTVTDSRVAVGLPTLNDSAGYNFEQIADRIEESL